ncbi:MAG: hypothetical protein ACE5GR_05615 [Nitrosopumilus sp.]
MDNSDNHLENGALAKLNYALEVEKMSHEMAEHLVDSIRWVIQYCKKNNLPLPNQDKLNEIVDRVVRLNDDFNRKFTGDGIHRRLYRTLKQYSYKVLVPYHTVW